MKKIRKQQFKKLIKICKINYIKDDFSVMARSFDCKYEFKVIEDTGLFII